MPKRKQQTARHRTHSAQIHGVANDILSVATTIALSTKQCQHRGRGVRLCQALALNNCEARLRKLAKSIRADEGELALRRAEEKVCDIPCTECEGTGKQHPTFADHCTLDCPHCHGQGRIPAEEQQAQTQKESE